MRLESCVDYNIIKEHISEEQLKIMSNIIEHYLWYLGEFDDGDCDIIGDYKNEYGNYIVINWYEGLITTKEFLEEVEDNGGSVV